jgi:hypothetical protein
VSGNTNIFRCRPRQEFTALPNRIANDEKLSARSLGVLYYILTKPADWRVIPQQLGARFGMSYRVILSVIGELSTAGYVKREIVIENYRITGTRYLVSDEPGFFGAEPDNHSEAEGLSIAPDPLVDFPACSKSSLTTNRHPIQRTERYKTTSHQTLQPDATSEGSPMGMAGKPPSAAYRPSSHDRGRIELEIANRIGARGFDALMALPETEVAALCARQRRGTLDDLSIIAIRNKFMHPT